MKEVTIDTATGKGVKVMIPGNCQHPQIHPSPQCNAVHPSHPDCDARWCVFNKEFNQAGQKFEDGHWEVGV